MVVGVNTPATDETPNAMPRSLATSVASAKASCAAFALCTPASRTVNTPVATVAGVTGTVPDTNAADVEAARGCVCDAVFSGTAAGIFAVLSWFLSKAAAWAVLPFQVLAGVCLAIFLIASVNIVKWWIVLARRAKRIV